jgi:hypothetical protein
MTSGTRGIVLTRFLNLLLSLAEAMLLIPL